MTIKSSGQLSLGEIMNEFGWPAAGDRRLGRFYRGGGLVPNNGANGAISTGGGISIGMFYGAKRTVPFSLVAMQTTFSLDYIMEIWIHFAIGQIEIRWHYFNRGGGKIWNYTTGAGVGTNDGSWTSYSEDGSSTSYPYSEITADPLYGGILYQSHGVGGVMGMGLNLNPGIVVGDDRDYIWKDGIGSSFAKPDIGDYTNLYMGVEVNTLVSGGRATIDAIQQPNASNGYTGYLYVRDIAKSAGPGSLIIRLDGS